MHKMNSKRIDSPDILSLAGQGLAPYVTWTSGQLDVIKTVAMLLMVIDHANSILGLEHPWMMWLGRGAFPLFGLVWAYNLMRHPALRQDSLNHLWVWALFAQLGYALAGFPWWQGNILFAFAVAGQAIVGLILTGMALVSVRAFSAGVQRFWPRDFFVLFYVGHLVLLGVLAEVAL